jgi:hypothetical protein
VGSLSPWRVGGGSANSTTSTNNKNSVPPAPASPPQSQGQSQGQDVPLRRSLSSDLQSAAREKPTPLQIAHMRRAMDKLYTAPAAAIRNEFPGIVAMLLTIIRTHCKAPRSERRATATARQARESRGGSVMQRPQGPQGPQSSKAQPVGPPMAPPPVSRGGALHRHLSVKSSATDEKKSEKGAGVETGGPSAGATEPVLPSPSSARDPTQEPRRRNVSRYVPPQLRLFQRTITCRLH